MVIRQEQDVAGGEAYQAGHDLIVNQQLSAAQMAEIMVALAGQLSEYHRKAEIKAQERYHALREEIITEFTKPQSTAKKEAFEDPDFQFVVREAHATYARSGKDDLRLELVKLLVERSKLLPEMRSAMILNKAISVIGSLTKEDISVLCIVFMMKAVNITTTSLISVAARYEIMLKPFVDHLATEIFSFEYLESIGCVTIERVADHYPLDEHAYLRFSVIDPSITKEGLWQTLIGHSPSLARVAELWPSAFYRQCMLTALGKAIAHSALESKNVMDAPLDIWVK